MLLVRRRAPEGSYFSGRRPRVRRVRGARDGLLGPARLHHLPGVRVLRRVAPGAETEATIVAQQVQTAQFLPADAAAELTGELVCYARSVVGIEWAAMDDGHARRRVQPVGCRDVPDHLRPSSRRPRRRAVGVRPVDGPDVRPRAGAHRPRARRGGHHPHAAVARPVRHLRRDLRLHAVLRRPRPRARSPRAC